MLSLFTSGFILLVLLIRTDVNCQQLTALKTEESSLEGGSVTLSCSYTKGSANYLFWYRQNPGKPPEFLKSHSPSVTDSAVYYCAVEPTVTGNTRTLYKNLQYSTTTTRGPQIFPFVFYLNVNHACLWSVVWSDLFELKNL
ncbi:hypothetical protein CHARACLAT_030452 [Characodon lateralis]|uniref:Ig-like domain-containing protein n=1 Tax=Characodon lateralis TaxID=208331 RepID=A0ABU7DEC1_9TELE|nr:hypothetical protein [Characodon lateralis]